MEPLPLSVTRVEDVTAELLGATAPELAAFHVAAFAVVLDLEVEERTAVLLLFGDDGDWRSRVADRCPLQWGLVTGEVDLHPGG